MLETIRSLEQTSTRDRVGPMHTTPLQRLAKMRLARCSRAVRQRSWAYYGRRAACPTASGQRDEASLSQSLGSRCRREEW